MKIKLFRFSAILAAIILGIGLVLFFTYIGDKSAGPFEDLLNAAGSNISELESNFIMRGRKDKRANDLDWFNIYLENPAKLKYPDTILIGAFDNNTTHTFKPILDLEDTLNIHFPLISIYSAWGDKSDQRFPYQRVRTINDLGSVPVITWEPWLSDFDRSIHKHLPEKTDRDKGGLKSIVNGDYDFYLKKWIKEVKRIKTPIFVRLGHEMNDSYRYPWGPHNNTAEDFIAMWKYVYNFFKKSGVKNVLWIWSPHPAYGFFNEYYPGKEYVDWIGIGTLNYGNVATWSQWWTFEEIFGNYYDELSAFEKPIMLTEFASLPLGGDRAAWYWDAIHLLPEELPLVKSLVFFHFSDDNTTTYKSLNWYIIEDKQTVDTIKMAINGW